MQAIEVLGIPFGRSYEYVKERLQERYGKYEVIEDKGNLCLYNIHVGDYEFHCGEFEFQRVSQYSYFYYARFQKHFPLKDSARAIALRESLKSTLLEKYQIREKWKNSQGYYCYSFYYHDVFDDEGEEETVCTLTTEKSQSRGGQYYIYVCLEYGPKYYLGESNDF